MVDERIKQLGARRFRGFLAAAVADVLEIEIIVLKLKVIPVLAPEKHTGVAVFQLKIVNALEDLRERFPALEIQMAIIGGLRQAVAAVIGTDEILVGILRRPTGAYRKRRVELTFDFTDVETYAKCRTGERRGEADGQRQFRPAPELVN